MVVIGLIIALAAVIAIAVYRSQVAPAIVVEKILKNWRPGYHDMTDGDWLPEADHEPLYRVSEYHVLKTSIQKDTASVLVRVNYQTGHREPQEEIYTFVLKKTRGGWKAWRYYKGFASTKQTAVSLQDILQQSPAAAVEE